MPTTVTSATSDCSGDTLHLNLDHNALGVDPRLPVPHGIPPHSLLDGGRILAHDRRTLQRGPSPTVHLAHRRIPGLAHVLDLPRRTVRDDARDAVLLIKRDPDRHHLRGAVR